MCLFDSCQCLLGRRIFLHLKFIILPHFSPDHACLNRFCREHLSASFDNLVALALVRLLFGYSGWVWLVCTYSSLWAPRWDSCRGLPGSCQGSRGYVCGHGSFLQLGRRGCLLTPCAFGALSSGRLEYWRRSCRRRKLEQLALPRYWIAVLSKERWIDLGLKLNDDAKIHHGWNLAADRFVAARCRYFHPK